MIQGYWGVRRNEGTDCEKALTTDDSQIEKGRFVKCGGDREVI